jgi:hypothetical protein
LDGLALVAPSGDFHRKASEVGRGGDGQSQPVSIPACSSANAKEKLMEGKKYYIAAATLVCGSALLLTGFLLGKRGDTGDGSGMRAPQVGKQNIEFSVAATDALHPGRVENITSGGAVPPDPPMSDGTKAVDGARDKETENRIAAVIEAAREQIIEDETRKRLKELSTETLIELMLRGTAEGKLAAYVFSDRLRATKDCDETLSLQRKLLDALQKAASVEARKHLLLVFWFNLRKEQPRDESILAQLFDFSLEWHACRQTSIDAAQAVSCLSYGQNLSTQYVDRTIQVLDDRLTCAPHTIRKEVVFDIMIGLAKSRGAPSVASVGRLLHLYGLPPCTTERGQRFDVVQLLARVEKTDESWKAMDYIGRVESDPEIREFVQKTLEEWAK